MANPFLAIPDQKVLVEGVCSKTGADLIFVGVGTWMGDRTCRWYVREVYLSAEFDRMVRDGSQKLHDPEHETMPAITVAPHVLCPCCGSRPWGFSCGTCEAINCASSIKTRRKGPLWSRKEKSSVCGRCGNEGRIVDGPGVATVTGVRDRGPAAPVSATTSTAIEPWKGWE